jgi:hypothetical protein
MKILGIYWLASVIIFSTGMSSISIQVYLLNNTLNKMVLENK